jgi:hypothetical protein
MNTPQPAQTDGHPRGEVAEHWDTIYASRDDSQLSWTQPDAGMSAELIDALPTRADQPVVDVGGGAGVLVDHLLGAGHRAVTVLDASEEALKIARQHLERVGAPSERVEWVVADVREWSPRQAYRVWHDRAVFHFLTDPADRVRYRDRAAAAIAAGGFLVIGTFSVDGPSQCSGLPVVGFDAEGLADQFAPTFEALRARDERHHTPWGDEQHFTWLVMQRHRD